MDNDTELLRRFIEQRDEAAFADFVNRNVPLVYSAALRRLDGDAAGAADVAQAVFTQVSRRASTLMDHPSLAGWLYSATRHAAANFARGERRRKFWENTATRMNTDSRDTMIPDWEKIRPLIDSAMDDLGEADREAVLLRFFRQQSFAEVGAKLMLSENAARMRVERALEKLRNRLRQRGVASTTAALALVLGNEVVASIPSHLAATISAGALAGSMVGTSSILVTVFTLMKQAKLIATAVAIIASVGFGVHEVGQARAAKAELAVANQQITDAAVQTANLQKQLSLSERDLAKMKAQLATLGAQLAQAQPSTTHPTSARPYAFSNPGYSRVYMENYQKSLPVKYAALFHALNLTPEQVSHFESALIECRRNIIEIWAAAEEQNLLGDQNSSAATSVARMTSDPTLARDDLLKNILGVNGFEQFKAFDAPQAAAARDSFGAISATFYSADAPLTATQGGELSRIINANTIETKTPMTSDGGKQMYTLSAQTDWNAVLTSARATLNSAQLETLQVAVEQQRSAEALKNFNLKTPNWSSLSAAR